MHKFLALFCLGLAVTSVYTQSCADTQALRSYYGFDTTQTGAGTTLSGVNFCNSIKNGPLCCSLADMQSFQTKSDAQIATLTTQASGRDTAFFQAGGQAPAAVTATMAKAVTTLNTAVKAKGGDFASLVRAANTTGAIKNTFTGFGSKNTKVNPINANSPSNPIVNGANGPAAPVKKNNTRNLQDIGSNSASTSVDVYGLLANLDTITAQLTTDSNAVTSSVSNFQTARSTCVVELQKVQAASWCLSCNPLATSSGYDNVRNTFTMGSDVCNRLKTACYPYLTASSLQNSAFNQQMLIASLNYATSQLNQGGNPVGQSFTYTGQQPAAFPDGCTSADSCNWICTTLFNNGAVNTAALINGGVVASTSSRLLFETEVEDKSNMRRLSSGTFNPSATEAGTTVAFATDPANIQGQIANQTNTNAGGNTNTNTGSGSTAKAGMLTFGSVFGGMVALAWSMMM